MSRESDWKQVRTAWVTNNPPSHEGFYVCGICGKSVHMSDMELDHIEPRSGSPQSFRDFSNLQPAHARCNQLKGSRRLKPLISAEEYKLRKMLDL